MTAAGMFRPGDLESLVTTGLRAEPGELYGWRCCRPDLRSRDGFRWPWPGGTAVQDGPADDADCGVGLHLAKTWAGAALGGYGCYVALIVAYRADDVLGEGDEKLRVRAARVLDVLDTPALIRTGKASRADLPGANLSGANLSGANLSRADLPGANLSGANLSRANLSGAYLSGAYLSRANLSGADLYGADLYGADLSGADLPGANLSGANLSGANLPGANLSGANLSRANLFRANLSRANLSRAYGRDDWDALVARGAIRGAA